MTGASGGAMGRAKRPRELADGDVAEGGDNETDDLILRLSQHRAAVAAQNIVEVAAEVTAQAEDGSSPRYAIGITPGSLPG